MDTFICAGKPGTRRDILFFQQPFASNLDSAAIVGQSNPCIVGMRILHALQQRPLGRNRNFRIGYLVALCHQLHFPIPLIHAPIKLVSSLEGKLC
jgi:hypothetical protein